MLKSAGTAGSSKESQREQPAQNASMTTTMAAPIPDDVMSKRNKHLEQFIQFH